MIQVQVAISRLLAKLLHTCDGAKPVPLIFCWQADGLSGLLTLPLAERFGLVIVDLDGPIPWHVHFFGHQAQVPAIVPTPECRVLGFGELAPRAAFFGPIGVLFIPTILNELQELLVADQELARLERLDARFVFAVFVVPAVVGVVVRFTDTDITAGYRDEFIGGRLSGLAIRRPQRLRPDSGEIVLADQHR